MHAAMIKSILVVAQDSPARSALIARLETEGYLVVSAEARAQAQDILEGLVPGAVFVDLSMPRRQGRLVADDLDQKPRLRMMPRLLAVAAWRHNTPPLSGAAVFVKPLNLDHVIRTLRTVYPASAPAIAPLAARRRPAPVDDRLEALLAS
jgi:CheY-like chemotaxis protein